jgi:hypothetical protein
MRICSVFLLASVATVTGLVGLSHPTYAQDGGVTDLTVTTIILNSNKGDQQIDMGDGKPGEITILDAAGRRGVSMSCYTTEGNHRVRIDVNNTNNTSRRCNSICYFVDNRGNSGTHQCSGTIAGRYNGEFCSAYDSSRTFRITDPGAFDCTQ